MSARAEESETQQLPRVPGASKRGSQGKKVPLMDWNAMAQFTLPDDDAIEALAESLTPAEREVLCSALARDRSEGTEAELARRIKMNPLTYRQLKHRIREKWRRS